MKLSDNIKFIRKENNLSQEQFAEKLGVSRQAVSKWESGQSYPEMDKVLLICKLFDYNIDELMNENVKEVNEGNKSKNNINKYVDDFFDFITKTVNLFTIMNFKQKVKCILEQFIVITILFMIISLLASIGSFFVAVIFGAMPEVAYNCVEGILGFVFAILALTVGIAVFLHIFKIRYLNYYEIEKENDTEIKEEIEIEKDTLNYEDTTEKNRKERIIIRDPNHSGAKFLNGIIKIALWFMKFVVSFMTIFFAFIFVGLIISLFVCFLIAGTGLIFFGILLGIISLLIINFIILKLSYNFIFNQKNNKTSIGVNLLVALILCGISIGILFLEYATFNYIEYDESFVKKESYSFEMTENLSLNIYSNNIVKFIETDIEDVEIVVEHSKYYYANIINEEETLRLDYGNDKMGFMEMINVLIEDLNKKQLRNYGYLKIYVYASNENINKLINNENRKYQESLKTEVNELYDENDNLREKIIELETEIEDQKFLINDLKQQTEE